MMEVLVPGANAARRWRFPESSARDASGTQRVDRSGKHHVRIEHASDTNPDHLETTLGKNGEVKDDGWQQLDRPCPDSGH